MKKLPAQQPGFSEEERPQRKDQASLPKKPDTSLRLQRCVACGQTFESQEQLQRHVQGAHNEPTAGQGGAGQRPKPGQQGQHSQPENQSRQKQDASDRPPLGSGDEARQKQGASDRPSPGRSDPQPNKQGER